MLRARTSSSLALYWNDVEGVTTAYEVAFTPPDGNIPEISIISSYSYQVNLNVYQLLPGKVYQIRVRTISGDQSGDQTSLSDYVERFVTGKLKEET